MKKFKQYKCKHCVHYKKEKLSKIFKHRNKIIFYNCKSIGKSSNTKACGKFKVLEACVTCSKFPCKKNVHAFDPICSSYTKLFDLTKPDFQLIFVNMLVEAFNIEQDADLAITTLIKTMKEKGFEVPIDSRKFQKYVEAMVQLKVLSGVIDSTGMSVYKESIIDLEIEKLFKWKQIIKG